MGVGQPMGLGCHSLTAAAAAGFAVVVLLIIGCGGLEVSTNKINPHSLPIQANPSPSISAHGSLDSFIPIPDSAVIAVDPDIGEVDPAICATDPLGQAFSMAEA
jgi:hypothetical protein